MSKRSFRPEKLVVAIVMALLLVMTGHPRVASAGVNPPPEEISRIFDRVAEKEQVPAEILKAIAYVESGWRQWDNNGNVILSGSKSRPNIGIMQVSAYDPRDKTTVNKLKNDIEFNIAYGAKVLISKWNMTPNIGDGDRGKLENWYFALWAYNSWSTYNNPNNAAAAGRVAYQDRIYKLMSTDYSRGLSTPLKVTPIPRNLIPAGTLPTAKTAWKTPEPFHYAGFVTVTGLPRSEEEALLASVKRIFGSDRIETAVKIAYQGWPEGSKTIILGRADKLADALAGISLAREYNAPILITPQGELDPRVEKVILDFQPQKIIIIGGEKAISRQTEEKLKTLMSWDAEVKRIAGEDRYGTVALIASYFPPGSGVAIASGENFADALSLAPAAATKRIPLLLVKKDGLPPQTEKALKKIHPAFVYVAGGEKIISQELLETIKHTAFVSEKNIERLAGRDRYETAALILAKFFPEIDKMYLATGTNFPDALAGAAMAACEETPLLLVPPQNGLNLEVKKQFQTLTAEDVEIQALGGEKALPDPCLIRIKHLFTK